MILFQDVHLGLQRRDGGKMCVRSPLAGVSVSLSESAILMSLDDVRLIGVEDSASPFSIMVQNFLKTLDTARTETLTPRWRAMCEKAMDDCLESLETSGGHEDVTPSWGILLNNLARMDTEEGDRGARREKQKRLIAGLLRRADMEYQKYAVQAAGKSSARAVRRLEILNKLPPALVRAQMQKAVRLVQGKVKAKKPLRQEEALFLLKTGAGEFELSDDTMRLCAAVLS